MRKRHIQFEKVPVAEVEKILKQQETLAKRSGKLAVIKTGKARSRPRAQRRKAEVLVP